jgi:hypothetical protein
MIKTKTRSVRVAKDAMDEKLRKKIKFLDFNETG